MAKGAFDKFMGKELKGAKKKEAFRQEKRKIKAEARAIGEAKRKEKWEKERGIFKEDDTKRSPRAGGFKKRDDDFKPAGPRSRKQDDPAKKTSKPRLDKRQFREEGASGKPKPQGRPSNDQADKRAPRSESSSSYKDFKKQGEAKKYAANDDKRPYKEAGTSTAKPVLSLNKKSETPEKNQDEKAFSKKYIRSNSDKYFKEKDEKPARVKSAEGSDSEVEEMPLNKFIAHGGLCGRREAAELVKQGAVKVNGDIVFEPGYKVSANDDVKVKGKKVFLQKNLYYILLNKPKDYITTASDPQGRKTVLDLIKGASPERVYPVGRLDRNTTGVLLLTNDGELAQKLTHPSYEIKKIYEVRLDKPVTKKDFDAILSGVTLEDGLVRADSLAYADSKDKSVIGIEIHSGRNRIVRRIFEHLGYDVRNLDRVMFANLTKKNVDRGRWRMLNDKEVRLLKYMNQSFVKKEEVKSKK